jgi:glycosyltransferase involved in cell wall biosynthesis
VTSVAAQTLAAIEESASSQQRRIRVLTLTPFYPSSLDPAQGLFVSDPLPLLKDFSVSNTTIAVEPFYRVRSRPSEAQPADWIRYFSLPGNLGLATAGEFLAGRLLKQVFGASPSFDLIHAHAVLPCGHAASILSKRLSIPFVVTVHGLDAFFTQQAGKIVGSWCQQVAQDVYRSAQIVVCISGTVRERVLSRSEVNTAVIYNGVDSERFAPADQPTSPLVVLSVGNLIAIKGHRSLLCAFSQISKEFPGCLLEIVGDGPERGRLKELAADLNIANGVRFYGRQSRDFVADAMTRCSVFALPSEYEGLGCVYLEAMSCAKPAIGCYGQGIEEVIEHGITGMLVPPNNINELAESIRILLSNKDLRARIGAAARTGILRRFTLQHQASELARLYRGCLP